MSSDYPELFQTALNTQGESAHVEVDGCRIHYVVWGEVGRPGIVLLHGSHAHQAWWHVIAPFLPRHFRVAAMDLSGAGDSGWRESYSEPKFAREVMAVADAAKLGSKPYVVGHSFGGFVTLETAHQYGDQLGGIILVDFVIHTAADVEEYAAFRAEQQNNPVRPTRVYPDIATAMGRFRLIPEQPCRNPWLVAYVGEQGIRPVEGGWTWKFDPGMHAKFAMADDAQTRAEKLLGLACPSAFLMAEKSLDYSAESLAYTRELTANRIPMITVPDTYHHLMFDEPLAVLMAIESLLMAWHLGENQG